MCNLGLHVFHGPKYLRARFRIRVCDRIRAGVWVSAVVGGGEGKAGHSCSLGSTRPSARRLFWGQIEPIHFVWISGLRGFAHGVCQGPGRERDWQGFAIPIFQFSCLLFPEISCPNHFEVVYWFWFEVTCEIWWLGSITGSWACGWQGPPTSLPSSSWLFL